ncbi:MAG: hypothetical protein ABIU05_01270 [Nitrospirales bacterium]
MGANVDHSIFMVDDAQSFLKVQKELWEESGLTNEGRGDTILLKFSTKEEIYGYREF